MNKKLKLFFLINLFILSSVQVALCTTSAPIVYIAGDGTGDFNCNGTNDQVQINQALQLVAGNPAYTTVHLKGPFTYVINDTIQIGSNTILEGDPTAVLKVADHAGWPTMKPLIKQISGSGNNNITVRGFEINGNYAGNSEITLGKGYYNLIYITHSNDIKVYNMYMHDGMGDGLRANMDTNIQFYNNTIYKLGHEGLFAINSSSVEAWNNRITCRTNSGLRDWNSHGVKFHDNVIDSFYDWSAGGPGIQIEKSTGGVVNDVEVYRNTIYKTYGPGIWMIAYGDPYPQEEAQNVRIHHNTFYSTGTNPNINWVGGIVASGFYNTLIENNVFDGVYHAAITHTYPETVSSSAATSQMSPGATNYARVGYDDVYQAGATDLSYLDNDVKSYVSATGLVSATGVAPVGSGYTTTVRNNIIVNTLKRTKNPTDTGYAVINYLPDTHTITLEYNCLYNNTGGNYKNATATTDIYVDPFFADQKNHNYYLMSKAGRWDGSHWVNDSKSSPCIDAGYPLSDYSNEPEPNGGRINIGSHGNTIYASKSELNVPISTLPTANFSTNVSEGYAPLSVQFTDSSKNATAWNWNFGDGNNSTVQNSTHTYSAAGNYTVNLTVSNGNGTNSKLATINVLEKPAAELPVANFSTNVSEGYAPLSVQFTDSSENATAWNWNFGDGNNSTVQNPTHTYLAAGNYTVNLTAINGNGTNSKLAIINVSKTVLKIFPGYTNSPTDPNHDSLYEDINGNGNIDFDDVVAYYKNMTWITQQGLTKYFDYNKNGSIEFDDLVKLYKMVGK